MDKPLRKQAKLVLLKAYNFIVFQIFIFFTTLKPFDFNTTNLFIFKWHTKPF
jgi:hypothetical protein